MVDLEHSSCVFFDMDGVLADFFPYFRKQFHNLIMIKKFDPSDFNIENYDNVKKIREFVQECCETEDSRFWNLIPKTPLASYYMELLKGHTDRIMFLTATPSRMTEAMDGKIKWIKKSFKIFDADRIIFEEHKEKYAVINGNKNILIDDSLANINKFNRAGGLGLLDVGKKVVANHYIENIVIPMLTNPHY